MHVFLHWLLKSEVVWKNISNSGRHRLHHICYNHQSKLDFRLMCLSCCSSTFKVAIFLNRTPQHSDQHTVNLLCTVLRLDCGYMTEKEDKCSTISKTKQRISRWRELSPDCGVHPLLMEHFSIFKLIVLVFRTAHCSILSLFWPQVSW